MTKPILIADKDKRPSLLCDSCEKMVSLVVRVGQEWDWESASADLCLDCLEQAVVLARNATHGG